MHSIAEKNARLSSRHLHWRHRGNFRPSNHRESAWSFMHHELANAMLHLVLEAIRPPPAATSATGAAIAVPLLGTSVEFLAGARRPIVRLANSGVLFL
jgi:hypothetical protein